MLPVKVGLIRHDDYSFRYHAGSSVDLNDRISESLSTSRRAKRKQPRLGDYNVKYAMVAAYVARLSLTTARDTPSLTIMLVVPTVLRA